MSKAKLTLVAAILAGLSAGAVQALPIDNLAAIGTGASAEQARWVCGVRRSSVSMVASTLQKSGLIRYRRGNIAILDRKGLQEASCECYGTLKAHYEKMISG